MSDVAAAIENAASTDAPRTPNAIVRGLLALLHTVNLPARLHDRLLLSRAKHPSLRGHPRMARRLAGWIRYYAYDDEAWFRADGATDDVERQRRDGFARLAERIRLKKGRTIAASRDLSSTISDVAFTAAYRVPFQFREKVLEQLEPGCLLDASDGVRVRDLDGNWSYDVGGSYGVNLFGNDFYKRCIARGGELVQELGPVLGSYHPVITDVVRRLLALAQKDEVSFHMSGTEAVMQAVRLARYHTGRSHVARFCGAYHGWWDGVQAGAGNPRPAREVYTLADMSETTLRVLRTRRDIACVLVNPVQAMHPNGNAPTDSMLVDGTRSVRYDRAAYTAWLRTLRDVCTERGIVLIFDEVFLGFRLAPGGAQEYFGVQADLVTWGKTLGGGLPIGVLCGRADLMRRFRDDAPADICFARGTFNSHPYVLGAMHEFLVHLDRPEVRASYVGLDALWDGRKNHLNERLERAAVPVRVTNFTSVWSVLFTVPGRYHWMLQFYLRDAGVAMSWIGTGRFVFSHAWTDADFEGFADAFVAAAEAMRADGWWWTAPGTTVKSIRRRVLRETLRAALRRASGRSTRPS
ncbi:MAG: aminotransferase class III-fold pyridoxal phosphate-dependent enzyme [Planctomycetes bacterium]|nr:aminotransferase class III-fold pyridoxal phosphate-dependent enzyme [Planctomycetota bacterium]